MSRADFEKWFTANDSAVMAKRALERDGDSYKFMLAHSAWLVWQAAESHTALRCWNICHEVTEASSAKSNIEDAYPDAFKDPTK